MAAKMQVTCQHKYSRGQRAWVAAADLHCRRGSADGKENRPQQRGDTTRASLTSGAAVMGLCVPKLLAHPLQGNNSKAAGLVGCKVNTSSLVGDQAACWAGSIISHSGMCHLLPK